MTQTYPIGTPGEPWGAAEKQQWLAAQTKKRSYSDEVLPKIEALKKFFDVEQYGLLPYGELGQFPLYVVRSRQWSQRKPTVLITGGVHGYETSGVHGALAFLETRAKEFEAYFNILVAPCISPWGYETINRWTPKAVDPNRSFYLPSPADECATLLTYLQDQNIQPLVHIDLHETTDTDNSEFRPALAARDGTTNTNWNIPDGFYLVADGERPQQAFQAAMIASTKQVTHIAPPDDEGNLIGEPMQQEGVIYLAAKGLGLCMGMTDAPYVTTTEVYPDSPSATPEICVKAQVATIVGGLDYVRRQQ